VNPARLFLRKAASLPSIPPDEFLKRLFSAKSQRPQLAAFLQRLNHFGILTICVAPRDVSLERANAGVN
jgi:hypothetical protein